MNKETLKILLDDQKKEILEEIWDMIFASYPKDMENFDLMTEDQAYRLLKSFWEKLEKKNYELDRKKN